MQHLRTLRTPLFRLAAFLGLAGCSSSTPLAPQGGSTIQVIQQQPPPQVVQLPLLTPNSNPSAVIQGPDLAFWAAESAVGKVARVTVQGTVTEYPLAITHSPTYISVGPGLHGAVWTSDPNDATVAQILSGGTIHEFRLPAGSSPHGMVYDNATSEWIAETGASAIGRINTLKAGITTYALPPGAAPFSGTLGPDKNLWFTEQGTVNALVSIVPSTGAMTQHALPPGRVPTWIVPYIGYLWFGESTSTGTAYLARMSTSGALTEFSTPTAAIPQFLGYGPLNSVWFASNGTTPQLWYATPGKSLVFAPPVLSLPAALPFAVGNDGNVWLPDPSHNSVDVYVVLAITATPSSISFTAIGQTQSFQVSEAHFNNQFYASSSNPSVASVTPSAGVAFTVTANQAGTAAITVADNQTYPRTGNATTIQVTVTTTNVLINSRRRR